MLKAVQWTAVYPTGARGAAAVYRAVVGHPLVVAVRKCRQRLVVSRVGP